MKAQLGIAPIAWSNDDLPELGGDVSLETCLSEARSAGFTGIETGGKFPQDAAVLGPILQAHDIRLCGGWYSGLGAICDRWRNWSSTLRAICGVRRDSPRCTARMPSSTSLSVASLSR